MQTYAVVVYVISDEILKLLGCKDEQQAKMSNAKVMTFAILAAKHFHSNYKMARYICKNLRLFPTILSNSRLNRRIHLIPWECWNAVFRFLALFFKQTSTNQTFVVDSFPVSWCGNEFYGASKQNNYQRIKADYPDAILLFDMGDVFKAFSEDALLISRLLKVPPNSFTHWDGNKILVSVFPHEALPGHIEKLVEYGHKAAICEIRAEGNTVKVQREIMLKKAA